MVRIGINTMVWSGRFDERQFPLLERIRQWGYEVVEIAIFDFESVNSASFRRALSDSGLALTVSSDCRLTSAWLAMIRRLVARREAGSSRLSRK